MQIDSRNPTYTIETQSWPSRGLARHRGYENETGRSFPAARQLVSDRAYNRDTRLTGEPACIATYTKAHFPNITDENDLSEAFLSSTYRILIVLVDKLGVQVNGEKGHPPEENRSSAGRSNHSSD